MRGRSRDRAGRMLRLTATVPAVPAILLLLIILILTFTACAAPQATSTTRDAALDLLAERMERYENELLDFVSIPTVSSLPEHQEDITKAAGWLISRLRAAGMENAKTMDTGAQPMVYADWLHAGKDVPTVLLYAHFDVQPVDPIELWDTPPFEPVLDRAAGLFRGRGVSDDKQGVMAILHSIEVAMAAGGGALPVNVKLMLEGQEELLSPNLEEFLSRHASEFSCDYAFSADGSQIAAETPGLLIGMRGMVAVEVELRTIRMDLHSGTYGGSILNPNQAMARLLASLHADDGSIAVSGFYEGVQPPSDLDRADGLVFPYNEAEEMANLSAEPFGEAGYSTLERRWYRPTLEVVGMWGGFTGEGLKTVLPAASWAKLSCRLVPGQEPGAIVAAIRSHVAAHCPKGGNATVRVLGRGSYPFTASRESEGVKIAGSILEDVMGRPPVVFKAGSSIPAMALLQRYIGVEPVAFGFTLGSHDLLHSPNERFKVSMYRKAHEAYVKLLYAMAEAGAAGAQGHEEL